MPYSWSRSPTFEANSDSDSTPIQLYPNRVLARLLLVGLIKKQDLSLLFLRCLHFITGVCTQAQHHKVSFISLQFFTATSARWSRSSLSTASFMRFNKILENTLPGTDSKVIPRQLLHSVKSIFLRSGMMTPFFLG